MHKTKEPLFHIVKRGDMPWYFSWCIRAVAIFLALVCCGLAAAVMYGFLYLPDRKTFPKLYQKDGINLF